MTTLRSRARTAPADTRRVKKQKTGTPRAMKKKTSVISGSITKNAAASATKDMHSLGSDSEAGYDDPRLTPPLSAFHTILNKNSFHQHADSSAIHAELSGSESSLTQLSTSPSTPFSPSTQGLHGPASPRDVQKLQNDASSPWLPIDGQPACYQKDCKTDLATLEALNVLSEASDATALALVGSAGSSACTAAAAQTLPLSESQPAPSLSRQPKASAFGSAPALAAKKALPAKKTPLPPRSRTSRGSSVRCCPDAVPDIVHEIIESVSRIRKPSKESLRKIENAIEILKSQFGNVLGHLCSSHTEKLTRMQAFVPSVQTPARENPSPTSLTFDSKLPPGEVPCKKRKTSTARASVLASSQFTNTSLATTAAPFPGPSPATASVAATVLAASHAPTPIAVPVSASARVPRTVMAPVTSTVDSEASKLGSPLANRKRDEICRRDMMREIESKFTASAVDSGMTHGEVTNRVIYDLLRVAVSPESTKDAYFLTGDEAYEMLEKGSPPVPVFTHNEQPFQWRPGKRPIEELFQRMENLGRLVSVQVPSRSSALDSYESHSLEEIKDRFFESPTGTDSSKGESSVREPWNILDLRSPLPSSILPRFLTSQNCQLLPRLRDEVLNPTRAERDVAPRDQWNEWRDVLEWVLLSEGGHNTSPHTDSHGLGTWITVQEGLFGFGWLSRPTEKQRREWTENPRGFTGGRWCFIMLEPGQSVFFNSGTVHFVFRQTGQATLALGGHVLQWTGLERWLSVVTSQLASPHITNEDMEWSAPKYIRTVTRLVEMRLRDAEAAKANGRAVDSRIVDMGGIQKVHRLMQRLARANDQLRPKKKQSRKRRR